VISSGANTIEAAANQFANSGEAKEYHSYLEFPNIADKGDFIDSLYLNVFGRLPDAAGRAYWVSVVTPENAGDVIRGFVDGAGASDQAILDNKAEVAQYYTDLCVAGTISYDGDAIVDIITDVDGTQVSVDAGKEAVDLIVNPVEPNPVGQDFDLTVNADNVLGGAGDDLIRGGDSDGDPTLTAGDQIHGGAGEDTLKVSSNYANSYAGFEMDGVENLEISAAKILRTCSQTTIMNNGCIIGHRGNPDDHWRPTVEKIKFWTCYILMDTARSHTLLSKGGMNHGASRSMRAPVIANHLNHIPDIAC